MSTESFTWKSAGLGPRFRLEIDTESVTVVRNDRATTIAFDAIDRIHVQAFHVPPVAHNLHVEIVAHDGREAAFHASGYGAPDARAVTCRRAAVVLLRRIAMAQPSVTVHEGSREDKPLRLVAAYAYLVAFAALLGAFVHFVLGEPETGLHLGLTLSFFFLLGILWTAFRAKRPRAVPATEVAARLEQS